MKNVQGEVTFYDSVSGKPLFVAPRGRTWSQFIKESKSHGVRRRHNSRIEAHLSARLRMPAR
jgi:hypothetical protein